MPLNQACLGRTYGPAVFEVTEPAIRAFLDATLDDSEAYRREAWIAPPTLAFPPCWPVILEALDDHDLGNEPGQIIHGEQVMRFSRGIVAGDVLTTTGTVRQIAPKGRNELYILGLRTVDALGRLVAEQENICISLGSAPESPPPSKATPREAASPAAGREQQPEPDLVESIQIPDDITVRYAAASGDHNAIHLDDAAAKALGFPGIIVHGMCLLSIAARGVVSALAGGAPERVRELGVRFASPLQPGDTLETHFWLAGDSCTFVSRASDGRTVLSNGRASIAT